MKTLELTDNNFEKVVNSNPLLVMVDFGAEWCPPCRAMEPVLEDLAEELDGRVMIGKVDVDANPEIAARYGVRNMPTFIIFKNGLLAERIVGAQPRTFLKKKLEQLSA